MKKKFVHFLFVSLALTLSCIGCSPGIGQNSSSANPGSNSEQAENKLNTMDSDDLYHYEVEEIWSKNNVAGGSSAPLMQRTTDGQILLLLESWKDDVEQYHIYCLEDNKELKKLLELPNKMDQWTPTEDGTGYPYVQSFDEDNEGYIYVLYGYSRLDYYTLDIYDKEGNLTTRDKSIEFQPRDRISGLHDRIKEVYVHNGIVYLLTMNNDLQAVTLEGDTVTLPFEDYMLFDSLAFDETGQMYLSVSVRGKSGSYEVLKINPENNFEILARQRIPDSTGVFSSYSSESGKLFLMNKDQVISCRLDGNSYQTEIRFGKDISLSLGEDTEHGLPVAEYFLIDGEDFLLAVRQRGERNGSHYRYTQYIFRLKKEPGPPKEQEYEKIITITASYRQDFLEDSVRLYQAKHPEIGVEWDVFYNTRNDFLPHSDDAGQKLLTKIMANNVGDIVATAGMGLNYKNALQTNAFIDLTDKIISSQYYNKLNQNTLKAITLDGAIRGLPVGTVYNVMRYTNILDPGLKVDNDITWSKVLQIGLDHPEMPLFGMVTMDRELNVLTQLFEANIYDLINFEEKTANLHEPWFIELMEKLRTVDQQGNLVVEIPLDSNVMPNYDNLNFFFELLNTESQYASYSTVYKDTNGGVTVMPIPRGEKSSNRFAYAFRMYSISSNSRQQDVAWDLLESLLSYEAQTLYTLDSTPINIEAGQRHRQLQSFPEELNKQFDVVENEIDYLYDTSSYRIQAVPILYQYLTGGKTLDDALKEAEYEIWLLLNE